MRFTRRAFAAAFTALFALSAPAHADTKPVRVFAAASLTDAFNAIGDLYAAQGHPKPIFVYAASSALARQIDQGAPADLFASADEDWMNYLAERKLIVTATRTSMLSNKLVLVTPPDRPINAKISAGFDLLGALNGGKLAMADPDSVPAGKYGRAALQNLGVWAKIEPSVVRAENVRAALRFVQTGEAAAGIVYLTDQMAAKGKVALAGEFPAASYPHISYPIAALKGGAEHEAKAFQKFLRTDDARAVFARMGFILETP